MGVDDDRGMRMNCWRTPPTVTSGIRCGCSMFSQRVEGQNELLCVREDCAVMFVQVHVYLSIPSVKRAEPMVVRETHETGTALPPLVKPISPDLKTQRRVSERRGCKGDIFEALEAPRLPRAMLGGASYMSHSNAASRRRSCNECV